MVSPGPNSVLKSLHQLLPVKVGENNNLCLLMRYLLPDLRQNRIVYVLLLEQSRRLIRLLALYKELNIVEAIQNTNRRISFQ